MKKKKKYLWLILLLPILYLLFGGTLEKKVYYTKTKEKITFVTKPSFFARFIKPKSFSKPGKYKGSVWCLFRKQDYEINVLSFDESETVLNKGEKFTPDLSGLTKEAKISSDVPAEVTSETPPGIHEITVRDHGITFKKKVVVLGFPEDVLYLEVGETNKPDIGVSGEWKSSGESISVDKDGTIHALKDGEGTVIFAYKGKEASLKVKVVSMKKLYWLYPGETFNLPEKDGKFSAGDIVKTENGVVKAIKCGKEKYTFTFKNLSFEGTVFITDFPKEKALLKNKSFTVDDVELSSSTPDIAEIDGNTIIAKQEGTCEIKAIYEGEERTCRLTVFSVNPEKIVGSEGEEFSLSEMEGLTFRSEDESIVRVENGKAVLTGGGSSNIIYKYQNEKGKIPVYSSSYENGDDTGTVIKVGEDGIVHRMTIWCQHARNYSKYNTFLAGNGCSLCSLTAVLNGYAPGYENMSPPEVMDTLEREVVGDSEWLSHHHNGNDGRAMPMTLYGVNSCLTQAGVHTEYIPSFERESMKEDILQHLSTGQPVVIEVSKTNQITGDTDRYWSGSVHTVVLVGTNGDKVIVGDPANVSRGSGRGRIKETTLDFISQYMWSCTSTPDNFYWSGKSTGGGYIKVYSGNSQ